MYIQLEEDWPLTIIRLNSTSDRNEFPSTSSLLGVRLLFRLRLIASGHSRKSHLYGALHSLGMYIQLEEDWPLTIIRLNSTSDRNEFPSRLFPSRGPSFV
ncbi:hypothetical protein CDAR_37511 [Caerostris darwini]|uniref:Uncharacterized protein n=1 Tax=Caerostris darwini TaxID=1538125 RepID=A0AAV4QHI4_9ARAC|nr:hypothetical protein CDAR_37511 [Caerostris darwini]